jgi:hypothetical protein
MKLGFRLIFCWRHPDSFEEARKRRLKISSNPSQYDDLGLFLREQVVLQELIDRSLLSKFVVDVTESSLEQNATRIADWLEATGGLTAPEESNSLQKYRRRK